MSELKENLERLKSDDSFERLIAINWFKENPNIEAAPLLKKIVKIEDNDIIKKDAEAVLLKIVNEKTIEGSEQITFENNVVSVEEREYAEFQDLFGKADLKGKMDLLNRITSRKEKGYLPFLKKISVQSNSMILNIAIQKTISFLENIIEKTTIITGKDLKLNAFDIKENFDFIQETLQDNFEYKKLSVIDLNHKGMPFLVNIHPDERNRTKIFVRNSVLNLNDEVIISKDMDGTHVLLLPMLFQNDIICLLLLECHSDIEISSLIKQVIKDKLKLILRTIAINKKAITDSLTQMYNRDYLFRILEKKIESLKNADASKRNVSALIFDIDHFKSFNDTYGHVVGDEVLKHVARITVDTCREFNSEIVAARYGGEEFMIVFPESSYVSAGQLAEKVRQNIEDFDTEVIQNSLNVKTAVRGITVSVGVYLLGPTDFIALKSEIDTRKAIKSMIEKSDEAMYNSKSSGRNQVTLYKDIAVSGSIKEILSENKLQASLVLMIFLTTCLMSIIIYMSAFSNKTTKKKITHVDLNEFIMSISDFNETINELVKSGEYEKAVLFLNEYYKKNSLTMKGKIALMEMRKIEINYLGSSSNTFEKVYLIFDNMKTQKSPNCYFRYKKIKSALDTEALDKRSLVLIYFYSMREYFARGNYYLAYRTLMNIREKLSKDDSLIYYLGVTSQYFEKESEEIIEDYNRSKSENEEFLESRGEFDIFSFSQDELNQLWNIYRNALIDKFEGRVEQSRSKFENVQSRDPYQKEVYTFLLENYKSDDDQNALFDFLVNWEDNMPDADKPKLELAKYYYEEREYKKVMDKLDEIKKNSPYSVHLADVYYYSGLSYTETNFPYKALQEFKKCIALDPNNEKVQELIESLE